ncbi:hypothetical protein NSA56_01805 [Oceanobacillus caeni]|uniref:hypothetical protein n=1 Tax=Oceanobacillus caeni TaxID=405946 RepID=UPI002149BC69|nr:hypothetical protein [Oceanobacillus caeni]MCR1833131.1 hypothetical protein [Oceanobacillus caeni]
MKKEKVITINEKEVTIKKIPVGKFAELMLAVKKLPSLLMANLTVDELENVNAQVMLTKFPTLMADAQDEIFKLTSVASGITKKEIEQLDFEEFFQVVEAILEVNNIKAIIEQVKNLGKVLQKQAQ